MDYDQFVKDYSEGDDIPMSVGIMAVPGAIPGDYRLVFSSVFVDYAFAKKKEVCDAYTDRFEKMWKDNELDGGFAIERTGDEQVYLASRDKTFLRAFEGDHVKDFTGAVFYATVNGDKEAIDKFFEMKEEKKFWVVQFRTTAASYLYVVDHVSGLLTDKFRMDPLKIVEPEGETT